MKCANKDCEYYNEEWLHNCANSAFNVLNDCPDYIANVEKYMNKMKCVNTKCIYHAPNWIYGCANTDIGPGECMKKCPDYISSEQAQNDLGYDINNVQFGRPQTCPQCGQQNPSGYNLPQDCLFCGENQHVLQGEFDLKWCESCGYRYAEEGSNYCGVCEKEKGIKHKMTSNGGYSIYESAAEPEPEPTGNGEVVLFGVMQDFLARAQTGKEKYGMHLRTGNGRNALKDAYQEALDLAMYLKQRLMEQKQECTCPLVTINGRDGENCEFFDEEREVCTHGKS